MYLSLKIADTPSTLHAFLKVELPSFFVFNSYQCPIVRPVQLFTQCVNIRKGQIKPPHIKQIYPCVTTTEFRCESSRHSFYKPVAISGSFCATLFLDDFSPHIPIRLDKRDVSCRIDLCPAFNNVSANTLIKFIFG